MKYFVTSRLSDNIRKTPEGYLLCIGVPIARTGTMKYAPEEIPLEPGEDGLIEISRDSEEVFCEKTMASFEGKPVTITHPNEFVDPKNWARLTNGIIQHVRRGDGDQADDLVADLLITNELAIGLVNNGLREVSCGYECDYIQTAPGKGIQKNIRGNHLALVEKGRAGSAYKINDHESKGVNMKSKLKEKIAAIFGKAQDEAIKLVDAEPDKKDEKSKDADADKKEEGKKSYDDLVKMVDALEKKIAGLTESKDADEDKEDKADKKDDKKEDDKESKDEEVSADLEDRLKKLEAAVAKLLENKSEEESEDDDIEEESEDADESEESEDDEEEIVMTGDTMSRAEILAPGIKKSKDIKVEALKKAYSTKDGKAVIDIFTGGKKPTYDSAEKVDLLFVGVSEALKAARTSQMSKTKTTTQTNDSHNESLATTMTAEKMNEINAKRYAKQ